MAPIILTITGQDIERQRQDTRLAQEARHVIQHAVTWGPRLLHEGYAGRHPQDDPTAVPWWVVPRLEQAASALGYEVTWLPPWRVFGPDHAEAVGTTGHDPRTGRREIAVDPHQTPAMRAKVLCHELAHAWCMERQPGIMAVDTMLQRIFGKGEEPQELFAELAAGIVTAILGITDRRCTSAYLAQRTTSTEVLEAYAPMACKAAAEILAHCTP